MPSDELRDYIEDMRLLMDDTGSPEGRAARVTVDMRWAVGNLPWDCNGHFKRGQERRGGTQDVSTLIYGGTYLKRLFTSDERARLTALIRSGEGWGEFRRVFRITTAFQKCPYCDMQDPWLVSDGKVLRIEDPCPNPDGIEVTEIEINVPSGKLVVANDLRDFFPVVGGYDIGGVYGTHMTMLQYAEQGLAHGFVGNTSPGVHRRRGSRRKFMIASGSRAAKVAGICTDLWWYSICDYDELERRLEHRKKRRDPNWRARDFTGSSIEDVLGDYHCTVVRVDPGVYRFRHYHGVDRDSPKLVKFAEIEWVRKPDPVTNLIEKYDKLEVTAGQALRQSVVSWPTLFAADNPSWEDLSDAERAASLQKAAEHMMLVGGNGIRWHENGFALSAPSLGPDSPEAEIPQFEQPLRDEISKSSALANAAGVCQPWHQNAPLPMNQSFQRLCFNMLRAALFFGIKPHFFVGTSGSDGWQIERARESMGLAIEVYFRLREIYPETAAEFKDLCAYTREELEQQVAHFDFATLTEDP